MVRNIYGTTHKRYGNLSCFYRNTELYRGILRKCKSITAVQFPYLVIASTKLIISHDRNSVILIISILSAAIIKFIQEKTADIAMW